MKKVTVIAIHNTIATTVFGPMDVFYQTGQLWNYINGLPLAPYFDVAIASVDGNPVRCLNNVLIHPHKSIDEVAETDLILIPSITNIKKTISYGTPILEWLIRQYHQGAGIASVCTGTFFLAETGLLNNKTATIHWGYVDQFQQMYPQVILKPERLITDEGDLFCAGALGAGIDLPIYLTEKYFGREVAIQSSKALVHDMNRHSQAPYTAIQSSKALVHDMNRHSQAPYTVFQFQKEHTDEAIKNSQKWIEENYTQDFDFDNISRKLGMSRRTFERRFKKATGDTPLAYLQRTRVEAAKRMLEISSNTFDEICHSLGYENSSHFRELFKKHTKLLPTEYQKKFSTTGQAYY
jgi:transcriptional regulator GlxA family with amidase domain